VAFAEEYDDGMEELLLDSIVAGATGLHEILTEPLTAREVNEHVTKLLRKGGLSYRQQQDLDLLKMYTANISKEGEFRVRKVEASLLVARAKHPKTHGKALARRIRCLYLHYRVHQSLPLEKRGGKRDGRSFLDDELIFSTCREWLISQPVGSITIDIFHRAVNEELFPRLMVIPRRPIGRITAYRWLGRLGFFQSWEQKGVYIDGHERPDVKEYRDNIFLPEMEAIDRLTTRYIEVGGKLQVSHPDLLPGEKRHVVYFHDESCFHAYDFKSGMFLHTSQQKIPRKGGKGGLIHVSDFIGPEGRIITRDNDGNVLRDARVTIYPGKNKDPWWDTTQLLAQIKDTLDIFEEKHPGCVAVLVFDQSSAHNSHGSGALNAFNMNLSPGGKQLPQNDTIYPPESSTDVRGQFQRLWTEDGTGVRTAKGIERILKERGCYPEGKKIKAKCTKPRCPDPVNYPPPADQPPCCLARILQNHKDFREQESAIASVIKGRGHKCLFLPKFHCELNPIEMYWGYGKTRYRQVQKSTFEEAKKQVPIALDACQTDTLRRFCNRSFRFMDAYRKGLSIKAAAWCVKKQKGHRSISEAIMKEFDIQEKESRSN